jgi:CBS domain-containing membrane protein
MSSLLVRDLMTERVYSVRPDENLARLVDLMDDIHVRHVPVVDDESVIIGLVSQRDLVREVLHGSRDLPFSELRELLKHKNVRSIMTTDIETVEPETKIEDAGQLMLDNKLGCLPVADGDRLVGILTEADFVKFAIGLSQRIPTA